MCFGSGDNWGVGHKWEVNSRIWDEVGLELSQINIEGAIESERGRDR